MVVGQQCHIEVGGAQRSSAQIDRRAEFTTGGGITNSFGHHEFHIEQVDVRIAQCCQRISKDVLSALGFHYARHSELREARSASKHHIAYNSELEWNTGLHGAEPSARMEERAAAAAVAGSRAVLAAPNQLLLPLRH
eukprot:scaffold29206_cov75-Phaeocystis_antarctica.AAC.4